MTLWTGCGKLEMFKWIDSSRNTKRSDTQGGTLFRSEYISIIDIIAGINKMCLNWHSILKICNTNTVRLLSHIACPSPFGNIFSCLCGFLPVYSVRSSHFNTQVNCVRRRQTTGGLKRQRNTGHWINKKTNKNNIRETSEECYYCHQPKTRIAAYLGSEQGLTPR